jgi:shikimate dehydrogenase
MSDPGKIPLAGVIGHPIAHSKSPALHGFWLRRFGLKGHYIPMDVAPADLEMTLRLLPKLGFVGVNVTIPHKEAALKIADTVTDRAALIGAANTLTFLGDGRIYADNTDGYGFLTNLFQNAPGWSPMAGPAAVLGAGGAARAVVASLLDAGVPEIRLANRTRPRADALRADFGARITVHDWVHAGNTLEGASLVVNTTSLGMAGKPEFRVPLDAIAPGTLATDLVYNPLKTAFLTQAEQQGATIVDGLGMLLHQAAPGFERWFGMAPVVDDETRTVVLST